MLYGREGGRGEGGSVTYRYQNISGERILAIAEAYSLRAEISAVKASISVAETMQAHDLLARNVRTMVFWKRGVGRNARTFFKRCFGDHLRTRRWFFVGRQVRFDK